MKYFLTMIRHVLLGMMAGVTVDVIVAFYILVFFVSEIIKKNGQLIFWNRCDCSMLDLRLSVEQVDCVICYEG